MVQQRSARKVRLTVTIAPDLHAKIQELAEERRGGVSGVVEDCVRCHLNDLAKASDPLIPEIATCPEEVQQVMRELLSPKLVREAMKIARQRSVVGEEIIKSRSRKRGNAVG